jgi:hypothetical protein
MSYRKKLILAAAPEAISRSRRARRAHDTAIRRRSICGGRGSVGGLAIVPTGLIATTTGRQLAPETSADIQAVAARARHIVMEVERGPGFELFDRETEKLGYNIESRVPGTGKLRFIEVKGRVSGAPMVTVTKNEILYSFLKPDDFILAMVEFTGIDSHRVHYLRQPFRRESDFGVTSVNYDFAELLARSGRPC